MIRKILFLTALVAIPTFASSTQAQAQTRTQSHSAEQCREYTKNVSINGRAETAYGTACLRPDGSWEIVSLEGSNHAQAQVRDVIYDDIERQTDRGNYRNNDRVVIVETYHRTPRYYKPHYRHHSVAYNYLYPLSFYFGNSRNYSHSKHRGYQKRSYKKANYHHGRSYGQRSHNGYNKRYKSSSYGRHHGKSYSRRHH